MGTTHLSGFWPAGVFCLPQMFKLCVCLFQFFFFFNSCRNKYIVTYTHVTIYVAYIKQKYTWGKCIHRENIINGRNQKNRSTGPHGREGEMVCVRVCKHACACEWSSMKSRRQWVSKCVSCVWVKLKWAAVWVYAWRRWAMSEMSQIFGLEMFPFFFFL